jgi:DNA-binding NtrC family response regulator
MSGHGTIDTAVEATKHGAMAFLEKPVTLQKLLRAVDQALQRNAPRPAPAVSAALPGWTASAPALVGNGSAPGFNPPAALHPAGPAPEQVFDLDRPLREARDAFERSYFEFHLARENGSMTRVAEKTGLERTHLYRKLKQLGVDIGRAKRGG